MDGAWLKKQTNSITLLVGHTQNDSKPGYPEEGSCSRSIARPGVLADFPLLKQHVNSWTFQF
jgi:hypothetical protein